MRPSGPLRSAALVLGIAAAAALLASQSRLKGSLPAEKNITIPMRFDPPVTPLPIVQARINGEAPLPFLVDTGLDTPMLIDRWAARRLQLQPGDDSITLSPGNVKMASAHVDAALFGENGTGVLLPAHTAYIGDLTAVSGGWPGPRLAGIIGAPMLASGAWQFNFEKRTMTLLADDGPRGSGTVIPLSKDGDSYSIETRAADGASANLLVDTGSTDTTIPDEFAGALRPKALVPGIASCFSGLFITDEYLLPRMRLGDLVESNVVAYRAAPGDVQRLGLNLLARFVMTIDFPRRELILRQASDYLKRSRLNGATGILLEQRNGGFYVTSAGDLAEEAGVRPGERVLSVDRRSLHGLTLQAAQDLLSGYAEAPVRLQLRTKTGASRVVSFRRESEFADSDSLVGGLTLEGTDLGELRVSAIDDDSPARRAGLEKDDVIIRINGSPVPEMSPSEIGYQLRRSRVAFAVHRGSESIAILLKGP